MKRTALFFIVAAVLGLLALGLTLGPRLPHPAAQVAPPVNPNPPTPSVVVAPPPGPQTGGDVLKLTAALSDPYLLAGGTREVFLKADIEAATLPGSERAPVNLALVLDRSGSMAGEKIDACRKAARTLVQQLDARDRFALVTFGSDVTTLISSTLATDGAKQRMLAAIDTIAELGGTNLSGGLEAALAEVIPYRSQYNVSRVVLLSDGQANEGISDLNGLAGLARRIAGQGLTLSAIGVGLDFNETTMESLAEYGGGSYHFLSDTEQLAGIFGGELKSALTTVAIGTSLSVIPSPGVTVAEVYGYLPDAPQGSATAVRLPDFVSSQRRKVVVRLLVPASTPGTIEVARVALSYLDVTRSRTAGSVQVAVSAAVTPDSTVALSNRNKEVAVDAVHESALWTMRQAGALAQEGKKGEAEERIQQAQGALRKAKVSFGDSKAFDEDLGEAQAFEGAIAAPAASPEATNAAAKRIHAFSNAKR